MAHPKACSKGTMTVTVKLLVLFVLSTCWACDARELMTSGLSSGETVTFNVSVLLINNQVSEGEVKSSEVAGNANVCTLCEEYVAEALEYLKENKTQTEVIDILHNTCSRFLSFQQKCITLVDYYVPLFFLEIGTVQPGVICQKFNLCAQPVITSNATSADKCNICQQAVAEVLLKLKDPDTQLEIIELLLKACDTVENYVKNCKNLVFEYGPLILANTEQLLETVDICTTIHACDLAYAGSEQASSAL